ncbi:transmembrane 9 family protein [archaeon]|nr:MAG: transmembrane 9 family protein [archaeon]
MEDDYFFELLIDDLPMWGYLGEVVHEEFLLGKSIQGARVYLYPHLHYSVGYNNDQIVSANVTVDARKRVDITDVSVGQEISFSYSVEWIHMPEVKYSMRMKRYADSTFLPTTFEIHWLSIINSFVLVLLLTAFLAIILMKILKNDFSKYMEIDEDELAEEETGWKMIHGDVFRSPELLNLFCAFNGAGAQLFCTVSFLLLTVIVGAFKATKRGALLTAGIMIYAMCGIFGGMVAGRLYKQLKGKNWAWNTMLTAAVFPVPLTLVFAIVNAIAWQNNSTAALPVTTIGVSKPHSVYFINKLCTLCYYCYGYI